MSVLIEGMEMPTGCSALTLKVWPDGQVEIFDADGEWKTSKAIPVPPHGRLIDADALMNDGWTLHKQVMRMGSNAIHVISLDNPNVPIVIPADKDGKDGG